MQKKKKKEANKLPQIVKINEKILGNEEESKGFK
jgi:hypothetical protein